MICWNATIFWMRVGQWKLEIMVYKVFNTDIFLHKCIASFQKSFINPTEPYGAIFMMDRCTSLGFKISTTIHCHYKAWKNQDIF